MLKVAIIVWIVLGTTLAGIAVLVVTSVPSFYDQGMKLIPITVIAAAVVAIPLSFIIAKQMMAVFRR